MCNGLGEPMPAIRVAGVTPQQVMPRRQVAIQVANSSVA
jgi:hypothetical protein